MGDQRTRPAFDGSSIQWETRTSKNGKPFKVGREKKTDDVAEEKAKVPVRSKQDFGIVVDWPVGNKWQDTTEDVKTTAAILQYRLMKLDGNALYNYEIDFTNSEHYDYYFYDETGDSYECNTFRNGDHYIQYNSDKPKIVFISGS